MKRIKQWLHGHPTPWEQTRRAMWWQQLKRWSIEGGWQTMALCLAGAVFIAVVLSSTASAGEPDIEQYRAAISACESGGTVLGQYDYAAQNPSSTASGRYQFLDSSWRNYIDAYASDLAEFRGMKAREAPSWAQDRLFEATFTAEGASPWAASRACWQPLLADTSSPTTTTGDLVSRETAPVPAFTG